MEIHQAVYEHQVVTHIPAIDLESNSVPALDDWVEVDGDVLPMADYLDADGSIAEDSMLSPLPYVAEEPQPYVERARQPQPWDNEKTPIEDAAPSNVLGAIRHIEHYKDAEATTTKATAEVDQATVKCKEIADGIHKDMLQSKVDAINADTSLRSEQKVSAIQHLIAQDAARVARFGRRF